MPVHNINPVYDNESRILILGSFPSVKSREPRFFYGHKQNRFWKVLAEVLNAKLPESIEEKRAFLLKHHIAVWDVIESCTITGSSDSTIKDVKVNDLSCILQTADISHIYANGNKSYELYMKYTYPKTKREIIKLPSTSPANAGYSLERLVQIWGEMLVI